ncbi:MAG: DUF2948 family protein [Pseudomonadota bacterium]|jgi:hypothetical protein|uniref:DUF2948 family protein n=1 Tax=Thalassovita sp. TaxID=1979401 RepID=UPI002AB274FC|nr:DUF2948 family protein [Thalassovita sp.]MEC7965904.1 DUF2948 family protein [Pseudomonadota bacterium]MEC8041752.1 DUF2948 family protein [Pseudomonadota bacterium]MEC8294159.1 DUF2948 family protein [Pseudomonadota bacterium]|tara:strand:+ start:279 stop:752 length:474 start_codon:yes stop_codon:yes gene_type:complete
MQDDARFEDGQEKPLNLGAFDGEDLKVLSALVQDAVFPVSEMRWQASERRFALLLNRFRWEDEGLKRHGAERVQSVLVIDNVQGVSSQGIDRKDKDIILSLLSIDWQPGEDADGALELVLAGDGAIRLTVEALEVSLRDVTRPYRAPSGKAPEHDLS